jgi:hypothetical protein
MEAWISLISHFSEELLIFELLLFFALLSGFCLLVISRKRRYPEASVVVPAQVFQASIDQLIGEAESLREQLFGEGLPKNPRAPRPTVTLVTTSGANTEENPAQPDVNIAPTGASTNAAPARVAAADSHTAHVAEIEALRAQVAKLQAENAALASQKSSSAVGTVPNQGMDSGAIKAAEGSTEKDLLEKIRVLEERLEEYSVIEDDLANLKRLQQENAQLRAQLEAMGGAKPGATASATAAAPTTATPSATAAVSEPPSGASVQPNPKTEVASEHAPNSPTEAQSQGGGDEDLLAEFEKILNS